MMKKLIGITTALILSIIVTVCALTVTADNSGTDVNSTEYSVFIVVTPAISVEPPSGWPGEEIVVSGSGFMPKAQIQELSIGDAPIVPLYQLGLTDSLGRFEVTGMIPGVMPGTRLLKARVIQPPDDPVAIPFRILGSFSPGTPSGPPQVSVEPNAASPGEKISVIGINFTPLCYVQEISISDAPIVPMYELPVTSGSGSFEVKGIVPGVMTGGHPLAVRVTQPQDAPVYAPFVVITPPHVVCTVEQGFATIAGKYTQVWTFNEELHEWMVYDTADGAPDDYNTLVSGQGYWVEVTEDCTLRFTAGTWNMKKGWNLIGWIAW